MQEENNCSCATSSDGNVNEIEASNVEENLSEEAMVIKEIPSSSWEDIVRQTRYVIAPMVDQSELPYRLLSKRYGAHLCYSPMYHSAIFIRDAKYRREALASCPEDRPLIVQFCANTVENFVQAALLAEPYCDAVDLNLGCPQSIARRGHYGAFLEDEWDLIAEMVSKCCQALRKPVTCKIRVFEDVEKTVRYAQMIERAGAKLLAVHGRTKEQKGALMGRASWAHIRAVKQAVKVPVIANGNVQTVADADRCMLETGCDAVMVAEGSLHNPTIFAGVKKPICDVALEYLDLVKAYPCPLAYARGHMFKMLHKVLETHPEYRDKFAHAKSLEAVRNVVTSLAVLSKANGQDSATQTDDSYWLCQPYNRPINGEERPERKEPKLGQGDDVDPNVSRNKRKKLRRNPLKSFDPPKAPRFMLCACGMPLSERCERKMCRTCCWKEMRTLGVSCSGHKKRTVTERKRMAMQDTAVTVATSAVLVAATE